MTHEEAMLKLLQVSPAERGELVQCTGWPTAETLRVLNKLVAEKQVRYRIAGRAFVYMVKDHDEDGAVL